MAVIPYLTTSNTIPQMMSKVNAIIDFFDQRDSANELRYVPFGTITANNIQVAVQQVENQANTKINTLTSSLIANTAALTTSINNAETRATDSAVAMAIALG